MSHRQMVFTILAACGSAVLASVFTTLLVLGRPASAQMTQPAESARLNAILRQISVDNAGNVLIRGRNVRIDATSNVAVTAKEAVTVSAMTNASISAAVNTSLYAGVNASIAARGNASVNAAAQTTIASGASTTVRSGATTAIKGSMVTLN